MWPLSLLYKKLVAELKKIDEKPMNTSNTFFLSDLYFF